MLEIIRAVRLTNRVQGSLFVTIKMIDGQLFKNVEVLDTTETGFIVNNEGKLTLCVLANIITVEFANV